MGDRFLLCGVRSGPFSSSGKIVAIDLTTKRVSAVVEDTPGCVHSLTSNDSLVVAGCRKGALVMKWSVEEGGKIKMEKMEECFEPRPVQKKKEGNNVARDFRQKCSTFDTDAECHFSEESDDTNKASKDEDDDDKGEKEKEKKEDGDDKEEEEKKGESGGDEDKIEVVEEEEAKEEPSDPEPGAGLSVWMNGSHLVARGSGCKTLQTYKIDGDKFTWLRDLELDGEIWTRGLLFSGSDGDSFWAAVNRDLLLYEDGELAKRIPVDNSQADLLSCISRCYK